MSDGPPEDPGAEASDQAGRDPAHGRRKDGKPYKDGNTRDDGSYAVGKYRPDKKHQFQVNDGRKRGKREKGSKNVNTIWRKQLSRKITLDGKTQTALEWIVEGTIRRGITTSDRASEVALHRAEGLERNSDSKLGLSDQEIVDAWLGLRLAEMIAEVSDDLDLEGGDDADSEIGGSDADQ